MRMPGSASTRSVRRSNPGSPVISSLPLPAVTEAARSMVALPGYSTTPVTRAWAAPAISSRNNAPPRIPFFMVALLSSSTIQRKAGRFGLSQVLLEKSHGALPGKLGRRLVVARRGIIVEAMLRARVLVHFVRHLRGLQRLLERRPHRVDALVVFGIVDQQGRLDLRHGRGLGRGTVERRRGVQRAAHCRGDVVRRSAAPAESRDAQLAR